jgi:hypothetical protein
MAEYLPHLFGADGKPEDWIRKRKTKIGNIQIAVQYQAKKPSERMP